jgi:hypothetical protein
MVEMDYGTLRRHGLIEKPPDIPAGPEGVYLNEWKDWADWLGHSRRIGGWRPFKEAREYARKLNLKHRKEWFELAKKRNSATENGLPDDISSYPDNVYEEWIGWWDWLGTAHRRGEWLRFNIARALSRRLGLTNEAHFIKWRRGHLKHRLRCPPNMPMHPDRVYPEFKGWSDFLGFTPRTWMPFDKAREFVRALRLKNQSEYREWSVGRLRSFIRKLKLPSRTEYSKWANGGLRGLPEKPPEVPVVPFKKYLNDWCGWDDWLGTGVDSTR